MRILRKSLRPAAGLRLARSLVLVLLLSTCVDQPELPDDTLHFDPSLIGQQVEAAVWAFHAADTARDAEAVIDLLWPDFTMLADGNRLRYSDAAAGSREFMASLELFHTEWSDLEILPLGPDVAVASFQFRDSIVTLTGDVIQSQGPTTFVWQRRDGVWRVLFADSDHYPIDP